MSEIKNPDVIYKTVSYSREKKVNPGLVNQKFQFMSESFQFSGWVDVSGTPEEAAAAHKDLQLFIDSQIDEKTAEIIEYYRRIASSQLVPLNAVREAFIYLMNNMSQDPGTALSIDEIWDRLREVIETFAAQQTA